MAVKKTLELILDSDEFILEEIKKLQVFFALKQVIRYGHKRDGIVDTESVAEHVYGMQVLASYFIPLEDKDGVWNKEQIFQMALFHDVGEIETGDIIGYLKTEEDRRREHESQKIITKKFPKSLQNTAETLLKEYRQQKTIESQFVKAIDKIEPVFHLLNENGRKIMRDRKTTIEQHRGIKDPYVEAFPYIKRFNEVASKFMIENGFLRTK